MNDFKHTDYEKLTNKLSNHLSTSCYHISAKDLKKLLGLSVAEIDEVLDSIIDIPIKKYRKNLCTYYMFPVELVILGYIQKTSRFVMEKKFTGGAI